MANVSHLDSLVNITKKRLLVGFGHQELGNNAQGDDMKKIYQTFEVGLSRSE